MAKKKATPQSLVVVSDLHCGCQLGLCSPEGAPLDEGGQYKPNRVQQIMWEWWREFWDVFVPEAAKGPYDILLNGDWIDNEHHGVKTLISNHIAVQRDIAKACMRPEVEKCQAMGGRFYVVRGTGAHDGGSGQEVEDMAKELGAIPNDVDRFSRWELWKRIEGPSDHCLVHALHHISPSGSTHRPSSAIENEIMAEYLEAARRAEEPPRFVVRSHRHRIGQVPIGTVHGRAHSLVTPGWQGKTMLSYRIAGARIMQPEFGGWVLRNGEEEVYCREFLRTLSRPKVEV